MVTARLHLCWAYALLYTCSLHTFNCFFFQHDTWPYWSGEPGTRAGQTVCLCSTLQCPRQVDKSAGNSAPSSCQQNGLNFITFGTYVFCGLLRYLWNVKYSVHMQTVIIIWVITRRYYSQSFPRQVISDLLCALGNWIIASFNSHHYGPISSCYLHCLSAIWTLASIWSNMCTSITLYLKIKIHWIHLETF